MKVTLSTIGTRGDVQPLVALALQLMELGQEVHFCVPPDFQDWIESLGMPVTPIGPSLRSTGKATPPPAKPTAEQRRQLVEATVAGQFEKIMEAARGCDVLVGATALQVAARSVSEKMGIPYVFVAYCPAVFPSPHHAPPVLGTLGDSSAPTPANFAELWARDAERFNVFGAALNAYRTSLDLPPVSDVRSHIFTGRPWLAADPVIAAWPDPADDAVFQTGAWILQDERPLSPELEAFLNAGEPPVFFGFGSSRAPADFNQVMLQTIRALGRRAIISQGWADLSVVDDQPGALITGEVNLQALFKRVAAVVHHGGAGTTTLAALAGAPQVILPQVYDQYYWAQRVQTLGIGTAHSHSTLTAGSLTEALQHATQPEVVTRAQSIAAAVRTDGALIAAQRLVAGA